MTMTLSQLIDKLKKERKEHGGSTEISIVIPNMDGIGCRSEEVKNIFYADSVCNIATTRNYK